MMLDQRENINNVTNPTTNSHSVDTDCTKSYFQTYDKDRVNESPGYFIFLIDQSGSMSGSSINIAKQTLSLFIKSLPMGSIFDIFGFGSSHKNYTPEPLEY